MRIGILTLHEADSYGAVLQAYALQTALSRLGARGEFVRFDRGRCAARREAGPRSAPLVQRLARLGARRSERFEAFRRARLRRAPARPWAEAERVGATYDRFIVGSDQVWNPRLSEFDERYFLPFAPPGKRYSYAASFGGEALPARISAWCAGELSRFAGLSVREESARAQIFALTGREARVCLDPTLLLNREDWDALLPAIAAPERYALLFLLRYDARLAEEACAAAEARGLKLRCVMASFVPRFGPEAWCETGVEDWLALIRGADCVFTNSFHAAIFSLIYARPLRVARASGELAARNERIEELMRLAGAQGSLDDLCPAPDARALEARLAPRRRASLDYLKEVARGGAV